MNPLISEELLHALIDGELGPAEAAPLLAQMQTDAALRDRVARLRLQKDLVRHAYADLAPVPAPQPAPTRFGRVRVGAAWALALVCGTLIGWTLHGGSPSQLEALSLQAGLSGRAVQGDAEHIVLHLSSGAAPDEVAVLDRAEGLLVASRAAGRPVAVEIVANSSGLDLLREGVSTQSRRIARLREAYPGLALVACGQTAQRLRETGVEVRLLPGVTVATSALDQIVERMRQGWDYVRI